MDRSTHPGSAVIDSTSGTTIAPRVDAGRGDAHSPYAPPSADLRRARSDGGLFRSPAGLGTLVIALLAANALSQIAVAWSCGQENDLLARWADDQPVDDTAFTALDHQARLAGVLLLGTLAVCMIAFLVWFHRARRNLDLIAPFARYSAGQAVWCWFVPILNLFRPFQIMRELRQESADAVGRGREGGAVLALWWMAWLIAGFLDRAGARLTSRAQAGDDFDLKAYVTGNHAFMASCALSVVAAVLLAVTIRRIGQDQDAWSRRHRVA